MTHSTPGGSAILNEFRAAMEWQRAQRIAGRPMAQRSFKAAATDRLTADWLTGTQGINALLEAHLDVLRERSSSWARNDESGRRFTTLVKNGIVGPNGFRLKMRAGQWVKAKGGYKWVLDELANTAIQEAWARFSQRGNCEVTGRLSFVDLCHLNAVCAAIKGEFINRQVIGDQRAPYQLQALAIDRLAVRTRAQTIGGDAVIRMGVEHNSAGRPLAYHLMAYNPADPFAINGQAPERVPADQALHHYVTLEPEQLRGVPWAHAVLLGSHLLHGFEESAVFAARAGASHMGFYIQGEATDTGPIQAVADLGAVEDPTTSQMLTSFEPGALELLPKGVKDFKAFDAKYPSEAFGPFVLNRRLAQAAGLDVTYHALTGDMTKVNYSSARIAELAERDNWRALQSWFVSGFVFPVFKKWLEMELLAGKVISPAGKPLPWNKLAKFVEGAVFQGRGWQWVDPLNEAKAAQLGRQEGFITRTQVVAAQGGDFEDNLIEIAAEEELADKHGVELGAPVPGVPAVPADATEGKDGKAKPADKSKPSQDKPEPDDTPADE